MTRTDYNDRPIAAAFALIGVLGILPALYGLAVSGTIAFALFRDLARGHTLDLDHLPIPLLFISVTLSGFWLLWQYIRRARNKPASIPQRTLWQLTVVQNAVYLCGALGIFIVDLSSQGTLYGGLGVLWFGTLTVLSSHAAYNSEPPGAG